MGSYIATIKFISNDYYFRFKLNFLHDFPLQNLILLRDLEPFSSREKNLALLN